jgi:dynein heavy chain 1, cytosolic
MLHATASCCGMFWVSEDVVEPPMIYYQYLDSLMAVPLDAEGDEMPGVIGCHAERVPIYLVSTWDLGMQKQVAAILKPYFSDGELVGAALEYTSDIEHIMDFMITCALNTAFSLIKTIRRVLEYNT